MSTLATELKKMYWQQRHNSRLPAGYRRVEYLESTGETAGEQYINTLMSNMTLKEATIIACDSPVRITKNAGCLTGARNWGSMSGNFVIWGGMYSNTAHNAFGRYGAGTTNTQVITSLYVGNDVYGIGVFHEYKFDNTGFWFDGAKTCANINTSRMEGDSQPLYLFALRDGPYLDGRRYLGKVASAKYKDWDSVLVRDLVPCVRISDSKPGMYDLCGSVCPLTNSPFYINSGTGADFLWGELQ